MIACDGENHDEKWFHLACVGLEAEPDGEWFCFVCQAEKRLARKAEMAKRMRLAGAAAFAAHSNGTPAHKCACARSLVRQHDRFVLAFLVNCVLKQ